MIRRKIATALAINYGRSPRKQSILNTIAKLEGGQMYSATLREILSEYHGIQVGKYTYGSLLEPYNCDQLTSIGRYVSIGPNVRRIGASHPTELASLHPFWYNESLGIVRGADVERSSCRIEHDSWIGAGTIILPSCQRIGIGAVIGAGSIVTRDVPDFAVHVGNPTRHVRYRFDEEKRERLLLSRFWEHEPDSAQSIIAGLNSYLCADSGGDENVG